MEIEYAEMALFFPVYIEVGEGPEKIRWPSGGGLCKINPSFLFHEGYLSKIRTFNLETDGIEIQIEYHLNKRPREIQLTPSSILVSIYDDGEGIKTTGNRRLIPAVVTLVFGIERPIPEDIIVIPKFTIQDIQCKSSKNGNVGKFLEDKLRKMLEEKLTGSSENGITAHIRRINFFTVSLLVNENPREVIQKFPKEVYGIALTDEGYRAVPENHTIAQLSSWVSGTRDYFVQVLSPTSIVQIQQAVDRLSIEMTELNSCKVWKGYVPEHNDDRIICHHGLLYMGQYIAMTFSVMKAFNHVFSEFPRDGLERGRKLKGVNRITRLLNEVERMRIDLTSYLSSLSPEKVSKIPEITTIIERAYSNHGLSSFSQEIKTMLETLEDIIADGNDRIERYYERETAQMLEIGIQGLAIFLGLLPFINSLAVLYRVVIMAFLLTGLGAGLWYRKRKVEGEIEKEANKFIELSRKLLTTELQF